MGYIDFALTIQAESYSQSVDIIKQFERNGVLEPYHKDEERDELNVVGYDGRELIVEYGTDLDVPDDVINPENFEEKLIISIRNSERRLSFDSAGKELCCLGRLKNDIQNNSEYDPEELITKTSI